MRDNPFTLAGKTILVTGASSGIGRATAIACSNIGARVILSGRNEEALAETLAQMGNPISGAEHLVLRTDLTDSGAVENLAEACPELDGLVNNAGISMLKPIQFVNKEDLLRMFGIDTFVPVLLLKNSGQEEENEASFISCLYVFHFWFYQFFIRRISVWCMQKCRKYFHEVCCIGICS